MADLVELQRIAEALEKRGYERGLEEGRKQGHVEGWNAARERVIKALGITVTTLAPLAPPAPRTSVIRLVLKIINHTPGLNGIEIVSQASLDAGMAINERSVRTALRRLRLRGYIMQISGAWQPAAGAPQELEADLLESVSDDDDDEDRPMAPP